MDSTKVIAGTGHRPNRYRKGWKGYNVSQPIIIQLIKEVLSIHNPSLIISGGCLGFDMALAQAALDLDIPYDLYIPYLNYGSTWADHNKRKLSIYKTRCRRLKYIHADNLSTPKTISKVLYKRDCIMVDNADLVIAFFNGDYDSGTGNTIRYANELARNKKEVMNIYDRYAKLFSPGDNQ